MIFFILNALDEIPAGNSIYRVIEKMVGQYIRVNEDSFSGR